MTDPIRDAVTQARRQQILQAAVTVFGKKGYHKTTIRDIARTAGVADGTIYNYFQNKEAIMLETIMQLAAVSKLLETIEHNGKTLPPDVLIANVLADRLHLLQENLALAQAVLPQVTADADLRRLFMDKLLSPNFVRLEQVMQSYIDRGELPPVDAGLLVRHLFSMVFGAILLAILGDERLTADADSFVAQASEILRHGLRRAGEAAQ